MRALQRAQAVADLLETGGEAGLQAFDVVALGARGGEEIAVGQHQRTGEVVGQANAGQRARLVAAEQRAGNQPIDRAALGEQGNHMRDAEGSGLRRQILGEV